MDGQAHSEIVQSIGSSLLGEIVYDDEGRLLTATFMDYRIPRARNVSSFETKSVPSPSKVNALGIKKAGEGGAIPG